MKMHSDAAPGCICAHMYASLSCLHPVLAAVQRTLLIPNGNLGLSGRWISSEPQRAHSRCDTSAGISPLRSQESLHWRILPYGQAKLCLDVSQHCHVILACQIDDHLWEAKIGLQGAALEWV